MSPVPGNNRQDPHDPDDEDLGLAAMDNNIIIAGSSSDSAGEDDDNGYLGYQALPQAPDDDVSMITEGAAGGNHDDDDVDQQLQCSMSAELADKHVPSYLQVNDVPDPELEERRSLWSDSRLHSQEPMEQGQINKIKSAMSGFHLPGCQVPEWARVVSEDDWKTQLLSRLQGQKPLVHSPPTSSRQSPDPGDPPSKRPKCGLDDNHEEEKPDGENPSVDTVNEETDDRTDER